MTLPGPNLTRADPLSLKISQKDNFFSSFSTLTFDLDFQKISNCHPKPISTPKIKILGPTVAAGEDVTHSGNVGNIIMWMP